MRKTHACMHACSHAHTQARMPSHVHAVLHACVHARKHARSNAQAFGYRHTRTHTHTRPPRQDRRPSCKRMNTCEHKLKHKEMNLLLPGSHLRAYVRCNRTITAVRANQVLLQTNVAHPRWISTAKTHDDHCNLPTNARLRH